MEEDDDLLYEPDEFSGLNDEQYRRARALTRQLTELGPLPHPIPFSGRIASFFNEQAKQQWREQAQAIKGALAEIRLNRQQLRSQETELRKQRQQALQGEKLRHEHEKAHEDVLMHEKRLGEISHAGQEPDSPAVTKAQAAYERAQKKLDRLQGKLDDFAHKYAEGMAPETKHGWFGDYQEPHDKAEADLAKEEYERLYSGESKRPVEGQDESGAPERRQSYPEISDQAEYERKLYEAQHQHEAEQLQGAREQEEEALRRAQANEDYYRRIAPYFGVDNMGAPTPPMPAMPAGAPSIPQGRMGGGPKPGGAGGKGGPSLNITPQQTSMSLPTHILPGFLMGMMGGGKGGAQGGSGMGGMRPQMGGGARPGLGQVSQFAPGANIPMPPPRPQFGAQAAMGMGPQARPQIAQGAMPQRPPMSVAPQAPMQPHMMPGAPNQPPVGAQMPPGLQQGTYQGQPITTAVPGGPQSATGYGRQPGAYRDMSGNMANFRDPTGGGGQNWRDPGFVRERENFIRNEAAQRGINPDIAVRVARSEGLGRSFGGDFGPSGRGPASSFGDFQLHYGGRVPGGNRVGGMGDTFGARGRDPANWQAADRFALDQAARGGWKPWHGAQKVGVSQYAGLPGRGGAGGTMMAQQPTGLMQAAYRPPQGGGGGVPIPPPRPAPPLPPSRPANMGGEVPTPPMRPQGAQLPAVRDAIQDTAGERRGQTGDYVAGRKGRPQLGIGDRTMERVPGAAPPKPRIGQVMGGYRYKGGDPSKRQAWVPVESI